MRRTPHGIAVAVVIAATIFVSCSDDVALTSAAEPTPVASEPPRRPDPVAVETEPVVDIRVPLKKIRARCGANVRSAPERKTRVVARAFVGGRVRVQVTDFPFYCAPGPEFAAVRAGQTVRIDVQPLKSGSKRANCYCLHRAELVLTEVPAGKWTLRVDTGDEEPVLRDGAWVNDPVEAVTQFEVPR